MGKFATEFVMLLCWAGPLMASAVYTSSNRTNYSLNFASIYTGVFTNFRQTQERGNQNAPARLTLIPVKVAALGEAYAVYDEWVVDGIVRSIAINVLTEQPGPSIYLTYYRLTDNPGSYKPGEYDINTVRNLTYRDLGYSNCTAVYKRLEDNVYVGSFPLCESTSKINGNDVNFGETHTCESYSTVVPPNVPYFSKTPFILHREGPRNLLVGIQDNYDRICGSSPTTSTTTPTTTTRRTTRRTSTRKTYTPSY